MNAEDFLKKNCTDKKHGAVTYKVAFEAVRMAEEERDSFWSDCFLREQEVNRTAREATIQSKIQEVREWLEPILSIGGMKDFDECFLTTKKEVSKK